MRKQQWTRNGRSSKRFQPGSWTKLRTQRRLFWRLKDKNKVHFASLMDICHLKHAELEPKIQKYKGRVLLRGDIVKDDCGTYAVFIEQGSSASQMTTAKEMHVIARLPPYQHTLRYRWRMLPDCSEFQSQSCPDMWIRLPPNQWPEIMDEICMSPNSWTFV